MHVPDLDREVIAREEEAAVPSTISGVGHRRDNFREKGTVDGVLRERESEGGRKELLVGGLTKGCISRVRQLHIQKADKGHGARERRERGRPRTSM